MDEPKAIDVPGRLYRFRPLSVVKPTVVDGELVGEKTVSEELEKREIFVARLDELNDPMDGLHHTVWDGDSAVWENFVRNYSMCLLDAVAYVQIAGDTATFDTSIIRTLKTAEDCATDEYRALYDDLIIGVQSNSELQALLRELCRREKLRHEELRALLSLYQTHFLREVARAIAAHIDSNPLPGIEHVPENTDLRHLAAVLPLLGEQVLGVTGEVGRRTNEQIYLIERYSSRETHSTGKDNLMRLIAMFPAYYLDAAAEDIHGEFYVASFAKSADDSSMWAHYAEQHRGVCLIFEAPEVDGQRVIDLEGNRKVALYPVRYDDSPIEVNFFANLGRLSQQKITNGWLRSGGETSRLTAEYNDSYPKRYWQRFIEKVSRKSANWAYEGEVRIVRDSQFTGDLQPNDRILNYKFEQLSGIIFGMKTPVDEQIRLIEVIEKMLGDYPEKKFSFYKAGYSPTQSRFTINELNLLELNAGARD